MAPVLLASIGETILGGLIGGSLAVAGGVLVQRQRGKDEAKQYEKRLADEAKEYEKRRADEAKEYEKRRADEAAEAQSERRRERRERAAMLLAPVRTYLAGVEPNLVLVRHSPYSPEADAEVWDGWFELRSGILVFADAIPYPEMAGELHGLIAAVETSVSAAIRLLASSGDPRMHLGGGTYEAAREDAMQKHVKAEALLDELIGWFRGSVSEL
jgi:gas vesicle protein